MRQPLSPCKILPKGNERALTGWNDNRSGYVNAQVLRESSAFKSNQKLTLDSAVVEKAFFGEIGQMPPAKVEQGWFSQPCARLLCMMHLLGAARGPKRMSLPGTKKGAYNGWRPSDLVPDTREKGHDECLLKRTSPPVAIFRNIHTNKSSFLGYGLF